MTAAEIDPPAGWHFVRLLPGQGEIWCGDQRAFLLAPTGETPRIISARCPHRGGPLSLGAYDCRRRELRCPWHGQRHGADRLRLLALPAIRIGAAWIVAVEGAALSEAAICFSRR